MKHRRYELLRESKMLPNVQHPSMYRPILNSLSDAEPLLVSAFRISPPWWPSIRQGNLFLSWGTVSSYPSGNEVGMYIVERMVESPCFMVRATYLDGDGFPVKAETIPLGWNKPLGQALLMKEALAEEYPDYFFDIVPQD